MDYTNAALCFKLKKAARYVRLYGLSRTIVKIKAQYHMQREYAAERIPNNHARDVGHVAIVGCGNFAYGVVAYYLKKEYGKVMRAAMDIDISRAASLYEDYKLSYYTTNFEDILNDKHVDLIFICSNHASHAEYAIQALQAGKAVHIEKPHVVNFDQLGRLRTAIECSQASVTLGFNRPDSRIGNQLKSYYDNESGPAVANWFVAGHEIEKSHWYFAPEEGGRVLGNLCHWTDFVFRLFDKQTRYPIKIIPARATSSDCDIAVSYVLGDGTIAAITFSAKGHAFEGVREIFSAHRGNLMVLMKDFKELNIDIVDRRFRMSPLFRDHGHRRAITSSYESSRASFHGDLKKTINDYIVSTAELFLATREALESNQTLIIDSPGSMLARFISDDLKP